MYLKRLEIHGFKSFANKTTMEFSQGIISIVGPNGSGKSNVADSLRWVLGEQSAKMIRGKKADDVIFAGSDKKTRLGFAEVVATFDNRDRRIPVDAAEVSIGRRIDRSGESEYLINGNRVRLLDIVDLVLKSNIGTSRYTVIGQGTIDQIVLQGPSGIKELVDEASGVKNYYLKREKTLRRLEQTAQNLMRAEDLIAEIEPRLKSLRRQAKRMEARAEIEQELKVYQREFFGKTFWSLKATIGGFEKTLAEFEQQKIQLEEQLKQQRQFVEKTERDNSQGAEKLRDVRLSISGLQSKKNKLLEDLSLIRGKMSSYKTGSSGDAQTMQVQLHEKNGVLRELEEKILASQTEAKRQTETVHGLQQQTEGLSQQIEALYEKLKNPTHVDWQQFDRQLSELEYAFGQFFSSLENAPTIETARTLAQGLRSQFDSFAHVAKQSVVDPQSHIHEVQTQLKKLQDQKEQLQQELGRMQVEQSRTHVSLEFLESQVQQVRQERLNIELELKKAQSGSSEDFIRELSAQEAQLQEQVQSLNQEISGIEESVKSFYAEEQAKQKLIHEAESLYRKLQDDLSKIKDKQSGVSVEKAKYDTQMEVLCEEIRRILGSEILQNIGEQPVTAATEDVENKIARLKNQLDMIGGMDELTMKEYQETETRYTNLSNQVEDLKRGMSDLKNILDELDEHIKSKFNEAFHKVNEKFEYYFRVLFNGGRAYLSVLKAEDKTEEQALAEGEEPADTDEAEKLRPEERVVQKYEKGASNIVGIDIKATPPGKKLASIQALSGGERALTSIALLCSLLTCFPSPFVVLDEVDAALDDANTIRFGQILGTLAHQTQFVTITHNRETMAQANILYGVTMGDDGVSKLLSVKLDQAKAFAK